MRHIIHIFTLSLLCLLTSALNGQQVYGGIMGLPEQRMGYTLGLAVLKVGPTYSGLMVGATNRMEDREKNPANMAYAELTTGQFTNVASQRGYQVGYFADLGRGFFSVGYETEEKTLYVWDVDPNKTITSLPRTSEKKSGGFAQVGYRFNWIGVYGHYGSVTGVGVGVSFHIPWGRGRN